MLSKLLPKFSISLALFLVAFIPRLLDLGRFLTADEFLWIDRSRTFLAGLLNPTFACDSLVDAWDNVAQGLACTLRTGHPGVTTMWSGTFGMWFTWLADRQNLSFYDYLTQLSTNPLDFILIAPVRFPTVLITSLWVVAVYWLLRRLFGGQVALVTALLLALAPFHIALSRVIHHDALSTTFMTLAVLTAFIYWGQNESRKWLLASGLWTGFAFLSKSPSLYLLPFIALVGLWFTVKEVNSKQKPVSRKKRPPTKANKVKPPTPYLTALKPLILAGLLWFAVVIVVVFMLWPVMWVKPWTALETVFLIGTKYASGGHAKGNFFLGQISNDPGPLFYPLTWLFRVSPLILGGVISLPFVAWFISPRRKIKPLQYPQAKDDSFTFQLSSLTRYLPLILIFILGYYLFMTWGEKKQDRYFLPVYPWLTLLAAVGLVGFVNYLWLRFKSTFSSAEPDQEISLSFATPTALLLLIILFINGFLVYTHYPYYFTYYNPLLGGPPSAARIMTVGWGEGLDLAADYLNHNLNPYQTRVSSWYRSTFAPYYYGDSISYSKEKGKILAGDYAIFYINQIQRRYPDDALFNYFDRFTPLQVISLHDIQYVWIYPSLGVDHYVEDQSYTGIASLLAWEWELGDSILLPNQSADFSLYWEYLGKEIDEPFFMRLVDAQGYIWAENQSVLSEENNPPPNTWQQGEIIYEEGRLFVPIGIPPGLYELQIGFYTKAEAVETSELLFKLPTGEAMVTVGRPALPDYTLPAEAILIEQPLGDSLILLGATWPQVPVAGADTLAIDLYWRIKKSLPADTELHLGLMDANNEAKQAWFNLSLAETFNPSGTLWQSDDFIQTRWQLDLLPELPAGTYRFELVLPDDTSQVLPFGVVEVEENDTTN